MLDIKSWTVDDEFFLTHGFATRFHDSMSVHLLFYINDFNDRNDIEKLLRLVWNVLHVISYRFTSEREKGFFDSPCVETDRRELLTSTKYESNLNR